MVSMNSLDVAILFHIDLICVEPHKLTHYSFEKNKGYGTKEHRENLKKFGISDVHRKSFNLLPK